LSDQLLLTTHFFSLDSTLQAEVYRQFYRLVYPEVIQLTKDHAATEDIIQESFWKAITKPPRHVDPIAIKGWIRKVSKHTTLNYLRKMKRSQVILDIENVGHPEYSIDGQMTIKLLWVQIVSELNPEYRKLLEYRYIRGLSYSEIAHEVGITEGAVRQKLARLRIRIKRIINKWEYG